MPRDISDRDLAKYRRSFRDDPKNRLALNAVTRNPVNKIALNRDCVTVSNHTYSHVLHSNKITSQNKSGRCWLFAGLNLLRVDVMKNLKIEEIELSQSYFMFWDKLEKANYFLESIIETVAEPASSRLFMFLVNSPIHDAGQWDMFVNLVKKYGVLPKQFMPESESSSSSWPMNRLVTTQIREYAAELRNLHSKGKSLDELRDRKNQMLDVLFRMLAIHLGEPPRDFFWQWRDKNNEFHRDGIITPQQFLDKYVNIDLDAMACLINCPTQDKSYGKMYTIEYLGNVIEGDIIRYLNVDMVKFKKAAVDMIKDGKPVWFGCDVGKMLERDLGILDVNTYDYGTLYGTQFKADKAERLDYGHSVMTHAMVLTGVDLDDNDTPTKWRVENSWGDKLGDKGYMVMTDEWFDEFMYEIAVEKKYLTPDLLAVLDTEPVKLPPWDPMGALAR